MALDPLVQKMEAEELKLLVETAGELVFASDGEAIEALRTVTFESPDLIDGGDVALPAVDLAAAYFLILGNVGRVLTRVISQRARRVLDEEGIEYQAASSVKSLPERYAAPMAEYDRRARSAVTPQAFLVELKRIRDR
ncbi:MAG: DUF1893 domain-containing protein [Planctomycetes bacterium]|nr:DUF1893 domain-containing protein [Planctomycetota bacterium]